MGKRTDYLRRKYDLSSEAYETLLESQNGRCASCRHPEWAFYKGRRKRLAVDHDHKTGRVRGLLCTRCNVALGMLDDNPQRIQALLDYLSR